MGRNHEKGHRRHKRGFYDGQQKGHHRFRSSGPGFHNWGAG